MSAFELLFNLSSPLLAPPSPTPSPPSPPGCVPGRDGIPDSVFGEMACGTWGQKAPAAVWELIRDRWPLLLAGLAVLVGLAVVWRAWRRHGR